MSKRAMTTLILLLLPVLVQGRVWHVEKDGSGDFTVIQDAVDAAASGDTVRIGPGRYEEYAPHEIAGHPYNMHVFISGKDLVLLGAGADATVIGQTEQDWNEVTMGIDVEYCSGIVSSLSVQNSEYGVDVAYGSAAIDNCSFSHSRYGIEVDVSGNSAIDGCVFMDNRFGVWVYTASGVCTISDSDFSSDVPRSVGVECQSPAGATVVNSTFHDLVDGVQYSFHANGRIEGCVFEDCSYAAVNVTDGSVLGIVDCEMEGGVYNINCDWAYFSGSGNILHGGTIAAIRCDHYASSMHESVIHNLPGGLLVKLAFFNNPPVVKLDFTHNDWGYDDPDSIAALIWDGNDDPSIYGVVDFEPFDAPGVANERKSWGDLKNLYR